MSYILDALKKSDQERQQRATPALNAVYTAEGRPTAGRRLWPRLLVVALLLNAGLLLWWLRPWEGARPVAPAPETQGQGAPAAKASPAATKPFEDSLAAASKSQDPAARDVPPPGISLETSKRAPEPPQAPPRPKEPEGTAPAVAGAVKPPELPAETTRTARVQGPSDGPPRSEALPASAPQAAVHRDKISAKPEGKKPAEPPPDAKRPTFGKAAAPAGRKDAASPPEGRAGSLSAGKAVKPPPAAESSKSPARDPRAVKAQNELEALMGRQVPVTPEENPAGGQAPQITTEAVSPTPAPEGKSAQPRASEPKSDIPQYDDLPLKIREEIPNLAFSMFVYSKDPGSRMVGIKGRVVREGQELSPGLKVESIAPDGAILNYRGQRFMKKQF